MSDEIIKTAILSPKGNYYEDFEVGRVFWHHWGRTIRHSENNIFSNLTMYFNPLYFNLEYAKAAGHPDTPVNPLLVFNTVFGMSVEDLSETGGAFLGVEDLIFAAPVYPNDTLTAKSTVLSGRLASNPKLGIVSWRTEGFNQRDERVIHLIRTNMVVRRTPGS